MDLWNRVRAFRERVDGFWDGEVGEGTRGAGGGEYSEHVLDASAVGVVCEIR